VRHSVAVLLLSTVLAAACTGATTESGTSASPSLPGVSTTSPMVSAEPQSMADPIRTHFGGRISTIPSALAVEMRGTTWKPGCPVPISDLRLLRFNYVGFDGETKRGPMVVNATVAEDVLSVFEELFEAGFPLKRVALAKEYKPKRDDPSRHRSVTASFNCRPVITTDGPQQTLSQHSYGFAVDVNPLQNPEVSLEGRVRDKAAKIYRDRTLDLPGMIHADDVVVRAFAAIGWKWGGDWSSMKDYMHFSATGK
jgi:hypothetical protein